MRETCGWLLGRRTLPRDPDKGVKEDPRLQAWVGNVRLAEISKAEDREHARRGVAAFKLAYGAKFGKAVAKITDDIDVLLAFHDFPAEHWVQLRTTNPIVTLSRSSTTVRHRTTITNGPGSKAAGLSKLIEAAQARCRAVNAPQLVALVRAGAQFDKGRLVQRHATNPPTDAAA